MLAGCAIATAGGGDRRLRPVALDRCQARRLPCVGAARARRTPRRRGDRPAGGVDGRDPRRPQLHRAAHVAAPRQPAARTPPAPPARGQPPRMAVCAGSTVRHVVLERGAATLAEPAVRALVDAAIARAAAAPDPRRGTPLVIKSVSARQRPRRPRCAAGRRPSRHASRTGGARRRTSGSSGRGGQRPLTTTSVGVEASQPGIGRQAVRVRVSAWPARAIVKARCSPTPFS